MKTERALVHVLMEHGLTAQKISRTGYAGADLILSLLRADRAEPLVVLPLTLAAEIARAAQRIGSHMNSEFPAQTGKRAGR